MQARWATASPTALQAHDVRCTWRTWARRRAHDPHRRRLGTRRDALAVELPTCVRTPHPPASRPDGGFGAIATSRPPDVCGSCRSCRTSRSTDAGDTRRPAKMLRVRSGPAGDVAWRPGPSAPSRSGTAPASNLERHAAARPPSRVAWPIKPEAGDVGARVDRIRAGSARSASRPRGSTSSIDATAASTTAAGARPNFRAVAMTPVPSGFVSNSRSPGRRRRSSRSRADPLRR